MKEFIKKWVTQNLGLKIISLIIAVFLWFIFTNLENPLTTTYFEVPVQIMHLDEYREQNRFIEIDGQQELDDLTLNVYYRGRTSEVEALRNRTPATFLRAYIDLYEIDPEDPNRLMIHYEIIDQSLKGELYSYRNKSYYSIDVEDYITREIEIRYEITGKPEEGYMFLPDDPDIQLSPKTITLTGPSDQVEAISYAFVQVKLEGESSNVSKVGEAILKDEDGKDVSYSRDVIRTSVNDVSVYIPIYTFKTVKIQPYLTGTPQEGYEYVGDLKQDIEMVDIYGQESALNKINNISLPEIDLSEITGNYQKRFYLQRILADAFGENTVRLMSGSPSSVTVSLTVEKQEERTIRVPVESITVSGVNSEFEYEFESEYVEVVIFGLPDLVDAFDESSLVVSARFKTADLAAGTHPVTLEITGLGQLKAREVKTNIILKAKVSEESVNPLENSNDSSTESSTSEESSS